MKSPVSRKKLMVANRSEIACRVFQACRELGIGTVAICAPGDEEARHLTYADSVERVSGYLKIDEVVAAAQRSGAELIHPGYGFLSERPAFAEAVEKSGLTFVGPRAETMELMGGKIAAKEVAIASGVPTLPWARVERGADIRAAAAGVGYPLLMKAAAGGGGKGMRRVDRAEELDAAAESASAEAVSSFGDGTLFLERLVDKPRHIEVQVFGDGMGGGVHLHERECSLQRRHQKVWEEATAPNLMASTREGLFTSAMSLLKTVKYRSAGTLEYLVDEQGGFYFLEMNTRLQVEHPVTELVTGVDLVHAQILQAMDPSQPYFKAVPSARGHAIEVRLYAEDPAQGFLPTPGKVERLKWATGVGIRVDTGIEEGQTIGTSFDSMLGKLIVSAENRAVAIERLKYALEETSILGLGTNQNYLHALCDLPAVREGRVYTRFLETEFGDFAPKPSASDLAFLTDARAAGMTRASSAAVITGASGKPASVPSPWEVFSKGALK